MYAELGFLRYADGRMITFNARQTNPYLGSVPAAINDFDELAGNYTYHAQTAFTRSRAGAFTTIPAPSDESVATVINASGSVVGFMAVMAMMSSQVLWRTRMVILPRSGYVETVLARTKPFPTPSIAPG